MESAFQLVILPSLGGTYPLAQQRLFDAMLQHGVEAPILVSGDVHMAQPTEKSLAERTKDQRRQCKRYEEDPLTSNLSEQQYELLNELPLDLNLRSGS